MQKRTMPDSKRAARRLAAIIHSDLSDRSPGTNFVVSHVSETFDDREGVSVHLIECAAPDGSRAMISVRPLPATVLAEQLPALPALRRTRVSHRADSMDHPVDLVTR